MRSLQRYCYVFLCAVLLSIGCSSIVNADETKLENLRVDITTEIYRENELYSKPTNLNKTIYPNNNTVEKWDYSGVVTEEPNDAYNWYYRTYWKFTNKDGNTLLRAEKKSHIILENGYYNAGYTIHNYNTMDVISSTYLKPYYNRILIGYKDGTYEYIDDGKFSISNHILGVDFEFTPPKDVISIQFQLNTNKIPLTTPNRYIVFFGNIGEFVSDNSFNLIIDTESVEAGLLSGIIGWIKNIYDTIVNLPSRIWEFISEGLKSLFVPSEEFIEQFKLNIDELLAEKFGAIYQVVNIVFEGWENITANDVANTVDLPEVTIPLPDNNEFTFGGDSVQIVPVGFEFLASACKIISGLCCTVLFVNGLKKAYQDIVEG